MPVHASQTSLLSKEEIIEEFNELQKEIDNVLEIKDNKYIFSKEEVTTFFLYLRLQSNDT